MTTGDVEITILDGGAGVVSVPGNTVQLIIGPATSGTDLQIVATKSPTVLKNTFISGPLPESAAMVCLGGGTAVCIKVPTDTDPDVSDVTATRVGDTPSSSVLSITGTATDEFFVVVKVVKGGTIGTGPVNIKVSLDAGRNFGHTIALGTNVTFEVADTGLTLNFTSASLDTGDYFQFGTTEPLIATGDVSDAIDVFKTSQYAVAGVGSIHIVGPFSGADADTIAGYIDDLVEFFIYNRAMIELEDASPPAVWGGSAVDEPTWVAAEATEASSVSSTRACLVAGSYNMPSAYNNPHAGSPRFRRNLAWALAVRQVQIPPQRHAGRVRDGALASIVIDPTVDPTDGFVYHNEAVNPGLDDARVTTARLRIGLPGIYITNPLLASPAGSIFTLLPLGNVMDRACGIIHQVGQSEINEDIRLNDNGTITENEAQAIERVMLGTINAQMTSLSMISSARVSVDRDTNVRATSTVSINVIIFSRGYVLEEDVTVSFANPFTV